MKALPFLLLCFFCNSLLKAQDKPKFPQGVGGKLNVYFSKVDMVEAGLAAGNFIKVKSSHIGYQSGFACLGVGGNQDKTLFTSRIGYEWITFLIGGRVSLINYTNFKQNQLCLLPEAGITLRGMLFLLYGYSIGLDKPDAFQAEGHSLNLGIVIPLHLK